MNYMTPEEIKAFRPHPILSPKDMAQALDRSQARMKEHGAWKDNQVLGRRYAIGCVALEITQLCNLDCTLCYLSENSESVKDIPIEEIFRRIDQIKYTYGSGTDVQITGEDTTLRDHDELLAIVRRVRELEMRPTLMTNGLKASRKLPSRKSVRWQLLKLLELLLRYPQPVSLHRSLNNEPKRKYYSQRSFSHHPDRTRGLILGRVDRRLSFFTARRRNIICFAGDAAEGASAHQ